MSDRSSEQSKAQEVVEQQSDNVAHAMAGAGGGLLSMALTFVDEKDVLHIHWLRHSDIH